MPTPFAARWLVVGADPGFGSEGGGGGGGGKVIAARDTPTPSRGYGRAL